MKRFTLKNRRGEGTNKFKIDYEAELNEAQLNVVATLEGPILVIAGAGSGKTRTLVYRVARLIETGVPPESILLLTFTRRSAQEMLQRASLLVDSRCDHVFGGTFHSVANLLLRQYGMEIGISPSFTILDRPDSEDAINFLRQEAGFHDKAKRFPKKKTIADMFGKAANKMQPLEQVLEEGYGHFLGFGTDLNHLFQQYQTFKRRKMLLDYDDLLVYFRDLLEREGTARQSLINRFRFVMVDEYQDTNKIQGDIISLLGGVHRNVMVVGDDSQSIYSFRGACFRNIMDFPEHFPGTKVMTLEENYRSTPPILDLTNRIIDRAAERYSKRLWTKRKGEGLPVLIQAPTEKDQSRFICQKVLEHREEGISINKMAVLFRSSFHSFDLEIELARSNIPFEKRGGFKFLETLHIKDVLAHLRVFANPMDAVSWNRLLLLIDGIGPKKCQAFLKQFSVTDHIGDIPRFLEKTAEEIHLKDRLIELIRLFKDISPETMTPGEMLGQVYSYYAPLLKQRHDDYPKRLKDLEHLYGIAENYGRLEEFLIDTALDFPEESVVGVEGGMPEDERLILSTIHSAKGLEWEVVFVIWLLDGRFPSLYSFMNEEELEEERRLLYVAATRAKSYLYLTYPIQVYDRLSGSILTKPSRFLDEIPKHFLDAWVLVQE